MNTGLKLRKAPSPRHTVASTSRPTSQTLQLAAQDLSVSFWPTKACSVSQLQDGNLARLPSSHAEHYWAARALSAETLLSTKEVHQEELRTLLHAEEVKRANEISALAEQHREKHVFLERLVIVLLVFVLSLMVLVIYLATHYTRQMPVRSASHFTIPILSPFTSVVEHETSAIGTRAITLVLVLLVAFAYCFMRYRLSRSRG